MIANVALALLVTLLSASFASAQPADLAPLPSTPTADHGQLPVIAAPPPDFTPDPAFWALISGYEGDTHGSGYGFFGPSYVRPIRPGLAWTARAFGSFLSYEFSGFESATRVRSPGVNSALGLRFGERRFFTVSAGPEVKWRRTEITSANGGATDSHSDTRVGVNVGGELYADTTSHNNVHGLVNYNTSDQYTWARLGFKEQISNRGWNGSNTAFVGVEGIAQGNHDIRSKQLGGFFEISHVPAKVSIVFKAGYKQSTFELGPGKSGPYFSVGFYRRLQ